MARKAFLKIKAGLEDALAYARRNNKHAYIVTTRVTGEVEGVHSGPVLGLHSNYTQAVKHFLIVLKDRTQYQDYKLYWHIHDVIQMGPYMEMRKARMEYRSPHDRLVSEEITIARWPL